MVKKKQFKFSILVDEYGKNKKHLNKLLRLLEEDYPFLKQAHRCVAAKRIHKAKKGEVIVFGLSRKYDFRVISYDAWEDLMDGRRFQFAELCGEWKKVKRYLDRYAQANHPNEYDLEEEDDCYCFNYDFTPVNYNNVYVVKSSPKKNKKKNKCTQQRHKTGTFIPVDEMTVHHNFVKIGWDVYDIWLNGDGEEYFKRNGQVYWIDRDSAGNGKVSVQ